MARHDELGREVPDPRPVSVPHGWQRPLTLQEEIRRYIRVEMSKQAAQDGEETFEEADDFDVEDEDDLASPYEIPEGLPEVLGGVRDVDADPPPDPKKKPLQEAVNEPEGDK